METLVLLGTVFGIGFVSGINLYATVLSIGLSVRFGLLEPSGIFPDLEVLSHPAVLWTAGLMYTVEFFADKIPWFDSAWDAIHTFIRPIGAAAVSGIALGDIDPVWETTLMLLCGGVALSSHATKTSTRIAANASPEPFSNWFLSIFEDVVAIVGAIAAFLVPVLVLFAVAVFLIGFVWFAPKVFRLLRGGWRRLRTRREAARSEL